MADSPPANPSFWARSATFFSTAMAFVVALAWKDAVHSMFEAWFPIHGKEVPHLDVSWQRIMSKKTLAMFFYAFLVTALAVALLEVVPHATEAIVELHTQKYHDTNSEEKQATTPLGAESGHTTVPLPGRNSRIYL